MTNALSQTTTYNTYNAHGQPLPCVTQETVWMGDIPVAALRPNRGGVSLFYVHSDHLNTP